MRYYRRYRGVRRGARFRYRSLTKLARYYKRYGRGNRRRYTVSYKVRNRYKKGGWNQLRIGKFNNSIVPEALLTKCKYTVQFPINITTTDVTSGLYGYVMLNDPYDPNNNLANASAQGFDFWRDYYKKYIVTKSKWTVHFHAQSAYWWNVYALPTMGDGTNAIVSTSVSQYTKNLPYVKYTTIGPITSIDQTKTLNGTWTLAGDQAALGRGKYWEESDWSASTTASPATRRALNIFSQTAADTQAGANYQVALVSVTVTYYVRFYQRKQTPELEDPE